MPSLRPLTLLVHAKAPSRGPSGRLLSVLAQVSIRASGVLLNTSQDLYTCASNSIQKRHFSSKDRDFQLDALPFSISPEQALEEFQVWANDDQGLRHLIKWDKVRIGAAYAPVWSFDLNIRFVTTVDGNKRYDWKPEHFASAYGSQSVMYISGLATYSGYYYRRSLINPILNTTLVFMGDKAMPFEKYMLRDMKLSNGERLEVFPDPWNATRGRAFAVIREDLEAMSEEAPGEVKVQTEIVGSRRVYMPTFVIDYSILGAEYKAFVSGCDAGAGVSGVNHRVIGRSDQELQQASQSFLSKAGQYGMRFLGNRRMGSSLFLLLQLFGNLAVRILPRLPLIGAIGGAFVGFRKIIQPWMGNRYASAEWERQREHESVMKEHTEHADDFLDSGAAKRYFEKHRAEILRALSGEQAHEKGEYSWYADWEEWARRQYAQQQQQQTYEQQRYGRQTYGQQAYGQQQRQQAPPPQKPKYQWDFDPNDPYSVLGIHRGATKSEVSAAFRKEMLKHHPDTQAGATAAAKERSVERSKLITEAYRKIKAEMK